MAADNGVKHVLEIDFQMDAVARLHIQMFHVWFDGYFTYLGMECETEVKAVVLVHVGCCIRKARAGRGGIRIVLS